MTQIYYDQDAQLETLANKRIVIIGYGSQGHAQAQNLRDSGLDVTVALRPNSPRWEAAETDGFSVIPAHDAVETADILQILTPDESQPELFRQHIQPGLRPGQALGFSHGFNIHYGQITPPSDVDVFMVAPKAPGHQFRKLYSEGQGVPGLVAIAQDATGLALPLALAYARGIGCTRAGVIPTTFREETETDLFGEQAVLCGGMSQLVKTGFETLVEAGYQPEIAYFECLHELKLIVDLMYEGGLSRMRYSVSDTAQFGDMTRGPRVIGPEVKTAMETILADVQSGAFAREWVLENQAQRPVFSTLAQREREHPIERVGRRLRDKMAWLYETQDTKDDKRTVDADDFGTRANRKELGS